MLIIAVSVMLLAALIFFIGPRVHVDTSFVRPELPDNLDDYLLRAESGCNDIKVGAEKTILWANADQRKTRYAFVYFHGFSACRQESEPVPSDIARHFESNIFYTRLGGNGRADEMLADGSVNKWVNDASEALTIAERIGEKTVIIACSTGATIAWWMSQQEEFRESVNAMILFSPNFGLADKKSRILLWPWGEKIATTVKGQYRETTPLNEQQAKFWTTRYPLKALMPLMAMVKLADKYPASASDIPMFFLYSNLDTTVDANLISKFYEDLESRKSAMVIDDPDVASRHVLVGDILAPQNNAAVTKAAIEFIEELTEV